MGCFLPLSSAQYVRVNAANNLHNLSHISLLVKQLGQQIRNPFILHEQCI